MIEELQAWKRFASSGRVNDYLSYAAIKSYNGATMQIKGGGNHADNNIRDSDKISFL